MPKTMRAPHLLANLLQVAHNLPSPAPLTSVRWPDSTVQAAAGSVPALVHTNSGPLKNVCLCGGVCEPSRGGRHSVYFHPLEVFPGAGCLGGGLAGVWTRVKGLGARTKDYGENTPKRGRFSLFLGRNSASLGPICTPRVREVVPNTFRSFSATL